MTERETRDFMSVDSFSQLPFLRPAPAPPPQLLPEKNSPSTALRLFGMELPQEEPSSKDDTSNTNGSGGGRGSHRKFECHYCCRNFPTSQALGGHQNAHKRERQHAKRAARAAAHHPHGGHVYSLLDYHHLGSVPSSGRKEIGCHPFDIRPPPPTYFSPWNNTSGGRFQTGPGLVAQPIDGSPLPGFWRIPAVPTVGSHGQLHLDRSLLAGGDPRVAIGGGGSGSFRSLSSERRLLYESVAGVQDHLSLDLHL